LFWPANQVYVMRESDRAILREIQGQVDVNEDPDWGLPEARSLRRVRPLGVPDPVEDRGASATRPLPGLPYFFISFTATQA
jgi:hypothetical protein